MSPDPTIEFSDAEFDARLRARVQRLDVLMPSSPTAVAPPARLSTRLRGPSGIGSLTLGIALIVVLVTTAGLWKQAQGGFATPSVTPPPVPTAGPPSASPTDTSSPAPSSSPALVVDCGPLASDQCASAVAVAEGTFPPTHLPFVAVRIEAPRALKTCPPSGGPLHVPPSGGSPSVPHICSVIVTVTTADGAVDVGLLQSGDGRWIWGEAIF